VRHGNRRYDAAERHPAKRRSRAGATRCRPIPSPLAYLDARGTCNGSGDTRRAVFVPALEQTEVLKRAAPAARQVVRRPDWWR